MVNTVFCIAEFIKLSTRNLERNDILVWCFWTIC